MKKVTLLPIIEKQTTSVFLSNKNYSQNKTEAQEYINRKVKMIQDNMDQVQQAMVVKRRNLEAVVMVMQQKLSQLGGGRKQ